MTKKKKKAMLAEIEAALRRAAKIAMTGTREERSGRFLGRPEQNVAAIAAAKRPAGK